MTKTNEFDHLLAVIKMEYEVDLFGTLYIRPFEDGTFGVGMLEGEGDWEEVFESPEEAVEKFIKTRHEIKLGTEYENQI